MGDRPDLAAILADRGYQRTQEGPMGRPGDRWVDGDVTVQFGCVEVITIRVPGGHTGLSCPTVCGFLAELVGSEARAASLPRFPHVSTLVRFGPCHGGGNPVQGWDVHQDVELVVTVDVDGVEHQASFDHDGTSEHADVQTTLANNADAIRSWMLDIGVARCLADNWAENVEPFRSEYQVLAS